MVIVPPIAKLLCVVNEKVVTPDVVLVVNLSAVTIVMLTDWTW